MSLKIYGVLRSRAARPIWMAKELGLAFEHVPVIQAYRLTSLDAPDAPLNTRSPAFLAVNPNGLVPCIDDDGMVLNESFAITLYLARRHGGTLAPRDLREEAAMLQWTLFAATELEAPALRVLQNSAAVKTRDSAIHDAAVAALRPKFALLDKALGDSGGFLVGGRFTVADLNLAEVVRYAQAAPDLFTAFAALRSWIAACQARPAFQEMMAARNAEPA